MSGSAFAVPIDTVRVVARFAHDPSAFTEGLFFSNGKLYESTGLVGRSSLRMVDPETGRVLTQTVVPPPYFGEGVTNWRDTIVQLTWTSHRAFTYAQMGLKRQHTFSWPYEGWGLTHDDRALIASDGTPLLRFVDPVTRAVLRRVTVTADGCPVPNVNELEWVDGLIYANIWQTPLIAVIDPADGHVTRFLDLSGLGPQSAAPDPDDVANGIAYDAATRRLFVTGKLWPYLYQVSEGPARDDAVDCRDGRLSRSRNVPRALDTRGASVDHP